jgi:hypothetical protein
MSKYPFGSKAAELHRSAEFFLELCARDPQGRGPYFALAMLYDSQHDRSDIKIILEHILQIQKGMPVVTHPDSTRFITQIIEQRNA